MQGIAYISLEAAIIAFMLAIMTLFLARHISERAKNLPFIYPSQDDLAKLYSLRELHLKRITIYWRVAVFLEVVLFSLGGYFLLGLPGALLFGLIVGSDYLRHRNPLSGYLTDPLDRFVSVLELTMVNNPYAERDLMELLKHCIKKRNMNDTEMRRFLDYLSIRSDTIGKVARKCQSS